MEQAEFCLYGCGTVEDYNNMAADEATVLVATAREVNMALKSKEVEQLLAGLAGLFGVKK